MDATAPELRLDTGAELCVGAIPPPVNVPQSVHVPLSARWLPSWRERRDDATRVLVLTDLSLLVAQDLRSPERAGAITSCKRNYVLTTC